MTAVEANFDGLVGLTHSYAGLSYGNIASASNEGQASNPREGVLQGLGKMRHMLGLGMTQGVLPPHDRPYLSVLRGLGFSGSDADMLVAAAKHPALLANLMSASPMWTANAATISPAADTADGRTHFTPANLAAMFHRSLEAPTTSRVLQAIFPEGERFCHHPPLIGGHHMGDEGAANHNRFCTDYGQPGVAVFVYGRGAFAKSEDLTYPGRQTREASEAVARSHGLRPGAAIFARQSAAAINAGAFHNDVVAVCNRHVFLAHEHAFDDPESLQTSLRRALHSEEGGDVLEWVSVPAAKVSLEDAIASYLFNSQLISAPGDEGMRLILPTEARDRPAVKAYVDELLASGGPIRHSDFLDVRQSMRNGGGPACLRLRVVLSDADRAALGARVLLDEALLTALEDWAKAHYRDRLVPADLGDPQMMEETFAALDALTQILGLGSIYDFQR